MKSEAIRLQKYLSERGVASRRASAQIVRDGRVTVNGFTETEPGTRIDPTKDRVTLDGVELPTTRAPGLTILFHKPRGYICSRNARQGKTIYSLLPKELGGLVPIGRLDKDSEGLLLLSSDGDIVNHLTHPSYGHQKIYEVTVSGALTPSTLDTLRSRLLIDGYRIQPVEVRQLRRISDGKRHVLEFTLREGRNRQIRKMCGLAGLRIHRLVRTSVQELRLQKLEPGKWRELTAAELNSLRE